MRSYVMLSVTIVLSFSILLGFMGFMDSEHYNTYKNIFSKDRSLVGISTTNLSNTRADQIQEKAAQYGTTHSVQNLFIHIYINMHDRSLVTGESFLDDIRGTAYSIPRECWFLQNYNYTTDVLTTMVPTWIDERESSNITLEKGEILMDEQLFMALGLNQTNNKVSLSFHYGGTFVPKDHFSGTFAVVGTLPSKASPQIELVENPNTKEMQARFTNNDQDGFFPYLVFSLDDFNPSEYKSEWWRRWIIFHSDQPESIYQMIKSMEPNQLVHTIYEGQNRALETLRTEKGTKAIIAALLMMILGINLYSSFENALNDRKFEIGVKRAMGASGFSIIRQFFYESMIVMIANIIIAVSLVVDVGLLLKLYRQLTLKNSNGITNYSFETYTLYITPYSVGMFAVCAIVLTVVFSFVFAYKTTQVQIVDYLKAE